MGGRRISDVMQRGVSQTTNSLLGHGKETGFCSDNSILVVYWKFLSGAMVRLACKRKMTAVFVFGGKMLWWKSGS